MGKTIRKNWKVFLASGCILCIAAILLFYFMTVRQTMYEESSQHLNEVSRQMAASIEKQTRNQWNMVGMFCQHFETLSGGDRAALDHYAQEQQKNWGFDSLCLVDGSAMYYDKGNRFSLLSREEVTEALLQKRQSVILDNILFGDESKLIFLAPVSSMALGDKKFQALGASYNSKDVFDNLDVAAFGGEGALFISHKDGAILFHNARGKGIIGYNLYDSLEEAVFRRGSSQQFYENVQTGQGELMTVSLNGVDYYLNHTQVSVDDWQLVMLVPVEVVSGRMQQVSILSFACLFGIGVLAVGMFILFYADAAHKVLRVEEEARRAAESANLAKSRFLSNMSHDIRTPMNAIIGMTDIAADHVDEPERVQDCLKKIGLSGRLLVGLINDILDMSKIESGKMVLRMERASLVDLMENLVNITQPMIQQKGQRFAIRLNNVQHETLCYDSLRLNQVFINLLGNALKFTPEGGSIYFTVMEQPAQREGYVHLVFRVADTGMGMSPAFLQNLFTAFTREQDSRVDKIEGSGLGMAITKMIVTVLGGSISVESEVDKGSVFTVEVDLKIAGKPQDCTLPPMRVLLADEDRDTGRAAAQVFQEMGAAADVTDSGREAVRLALDAYTKGEAYQFIVLDWRLADLGGVEAARMIREQVNAPCQIVVSAYDWSQIETITGQAGIDALILKPFFKSTLYRCVKKYVLHDETDLAVEPQEMVDLAGRHILLVEDNAINREIVEELLTKQGAAVDTAQDGQEAVERFAEAPEEWYDLVLMDIQMPRMNGYQATRAIRALDREDAARVPIFAMTADAFAEDIELAKAAGMNQHVAKPLDMPVMLREIKKYLR